MSDKKDTRTTAEKRAARYARKARQEARQKEALAKQAEHEESQERKAALATHAEELAAPARAEAQRMKVEAAKLPLPQLQGEGMYEARVVQALVEILTGRPTAVRPQKIEMPETIFEKIVLVLSSTEQFYYRVTEQGGCTCKGWHFSAKQFDIGYCRHYADAFPEQAARNKAIIGQIKADRKARIQARPQVSKLKARAEEPRDLTPAELEELKEKITGALEGKFPLFESVRVKVDGLQNLTLKYKYQYDYSAEEEQQVQAMIAEAKRVAPSISIFAGCM